MMKRCLDQTLCCVHDPSQYPGQVWYLDADNDGYSNGNTVVQCGKPNGYKPLSELLATSLDCADYAANIYPGAIETCDGSDEDCDNEIDEDVYGLTWHGNITLSTQADVDDFPHCYSVIDGNLTIRNTGVVDLSNLIHLKMVTKNLTIQSTKVENLHGLDSLTYIGKTLTIKTNSKMTTLSGLENLEYVGYNLMVFYNFKLTDCCPIYNLINTADGVGNIVAVYSNKTGCDNISQINTACADVDPIIAPPNTNLPTTNMGMEQWVDIFPNPADAVINISIGRDFGYASAKLFDLRGQAIQSVKLEANTNSHQFLIESLVPGVYLVQVQVDGKMFVQQLVVE